LPAYAQRSLGLAAFREPHEERQNQGQRAMTKADRKRELAKAAKAAGEMAKSTSNKNLDKLNRSLGAEKALKAVSKDKRGKLVANDNPSKVVKFKPKPKGGDR
jgi:hypothetical protein